MPIVPRDAARKLASYLKTFPVVLVVGPRQSGKTTLLKTTLPSWKRFDLDRAADYDAVAFDPDSFLRANPRRIAVDEAQRLPRLFPALRAAVDDDRQPGRYVLTGSSSPELVRGASESLAGRIGILELTPFGAGELSSRPALLRERWFWGGYPALYGLKSERQKRDWIEAYLATFVERDIPSLGIRIQPVRLRKFLAMIAHVHGGILNVMDLARSMELSQHTVEHYLDVLEGAFIIRRLRPYFVNIGKRLVKSPKLYIRDSGLFHYLSGLRSRAELDSFPRRGASWEGLVIEEIARRAALDHSRPGVYYWRTHVGNEADLVLETGLKKSVFEIKLGEGVETRTLASLKACLRDLRTDRGFVVYGGQRLIHAGGGITLIPWRELLRQGRTENSGTQY